MRLMYHRGLRLRTFVALAAMLCVATASEDVPYVAVPPDNVLVASVVALSECHRSCWYARCGRDHAYRCSEGDGLAKGGGVLR